MKAGELIALKTINQGKLNKIVPWYIEGTVKSFEIILPYKVGDHFRCMILVPDDYIGWIISSFHIEHGNVKTKYLGKKFYDIEDVHLKP